MKNIRKHFLFFGSLIFLGILCSCTLNPELSPPSECDYLYMIRQESGKEAIESSNENQNIKRLHDSIGEQCAELVVGGIQVNKTCKENLINQFAETHNCQ